MSNNVNNYINNVEDNTVYHTAVENNENTSTLEEQNKQNMDDMFNTFVQIINSTKGKKFFESFIAGDLITSTKIADGMNTFSHGDQSEEGISLNGSNNSRSATPIYKKNGVLYKHTNKYCELHKNEDCQFIDAERINKNFMLVSPLENARDIKSWIYQMNSLLNLDCMENILEQAVKIMTDIKNKFKVETCELNESTITNTMIRFMSKDLREYVKSRISEIEYC